MSTNWLYIDANFPQFDGKDPNERIDRLQNYLYMLTEQLRYSLQNLDESNLNRALAAQIASDHAAVAALGDTGTHRLTITYTANSYVTEENFNTNLDAYRKAGTLYLRFNLNITTALPTDTTNVEIGRISGWSAPTDAMASIAGRSSAGNLIMQVGRTGIIRVGNASGSNCSGYYRTGLTMPEA